MAHVLMLDPAIGAVLVGCYVMLLVVAASHKLRNLALFAQVFAGYGMASALQRWRLTWLVPVFELLAALGLLLPASRRGAAAAAAALILGYAIAILVNLRAGRDLVACGCGGPDEQRPIAGWMVWRNLLLAVGLTVVMLPWDTRPLQWTDALTFAGGVTTLALLYSCAQRLLGEPSGRPDAEIRGAS
jgi:uncharacterized membrane protein YphA (DoxX/SURF4 family)